ncbi:hypothetical protein [Dyadobacter sp. 3J3]|uniref:hypothetical protein n=1 Tax=Dyadobacter sp. 3J3 TaxID=2606600 RepID=UPI00135C1D1A|nr:hypothetical protein [Dyadobacter sp. 3J3]
MNFGNDRKRIILLRHKMVISKEEESEYNKLMSAYPDNDIYESKLYQELSGVGFLRYTGKDLLQNEDGNYIEQEPFDNGKYITTVSGELSLTSLFESELLSKIESQRFKKIESLGILIGGIGGLITLLTFLYHQIQRFLK